MFPKSKNDSAGVGNRRTIQLAALLLLSVSSNSHATNDVTGTVSWMEVWRNGNVAFTLSTPAGACNNQFILNASDPGTKTQFATLLAAKKTGTAVRVYSFGCGPAEGYGGSYNTVDYLYAYE